ncbi:carbamoyltransferase HypF [Kamptonema cortianum]|nr:carbamoyltransferase HypF [Oscillatoria laete-virens]MDK3158219.1 carbamoyltransferase HypF [Kamptonema cortianum]MDL5055438.1 carbamoyltransferase HypF [Oscillatoria laete-virens NRMC-F 0139]
MIERRRLTVQGMVQGVGFRPFVYRLAAELRTGGWVINSPQGVVIEVEASAAVLDRFEARLRAELPPHAAIHALASESVTPLGEHDFSIHHSEADGARTALILPDLATCPDCLRELSDPADRRYRYPFINCTHCGPRFSIIHDLPYDRPATTMRAFTQCPDCRAEYENPLDRRFHAQPNACPRCGPQLALWDRSGAALAEREDALIQAEAALCRGEIVAVKGLGGFHLMVDARSEQAVHRLRCRKGRYEKPLAVMYPSLAMVEQDCEVSEAERTLLISSEAPIVLLRYHGRQIAPDAAPGNPYLGVMLPYTPLHHLLLHDLGFPLVATSGNLSGEPICIDESEALSRLQAIADVFLVHDRPIARHVDDSVVCVVDGRPLILRRARGYAPLPVDLPAGNHRSLIAVGAHQKNTVALLHKGHVFLSQHLGDLDTKESLAAFRRVLADFQRVYEAKPSAVVCDLHPDYASTQYAEALGLPLLRVQHHYAHALSCLAEHDLQPPVFGVTWDGTGLGADRTLWGGEFLIIGEGAGFERVAALKPFPLPGGEIAARQPRRSLLGLLFAAFGEDLPRERLDFTPAELTVLIAALRRGINAPLTSSIGRLFDAVAALAGVRQQCSFEGQAAMQLEFAALGVKTDECYPYEVTPVTNTRMPCRAMIEWKPMLEAMLMESDAAQISAKFHNTLAALIMAMAEQVGIQQVVLTGGCFQNRLLLEKAIASLRKAGFTPYWQARIPPNDGGIALGQIAAALREGQYVFGSSGQIDQHQRRWA